MLRCALLLITIWSGLSPGKINISKQFTCSVETLRKMESSLQKAAERDPQMQQYMIFLTISKDENVYLICGPNLPDKEGKGCQLTFRINDAISIAKAAAIRGKAKSVEESLAKSDPNLTQDHLHFESPFEPQEAYASYIFCQPEGQEGKKSWGCYLSVHESVN